jgi:hypothetical protein
LDYAQLGKSSCQADAASERLGDSWQFRRRNPFAMAAAAGLSRNSPLGIDPDHKHYGN